MQEIIDKIKDFQYTSLAYSDCEDISNATIGINNDWVKISSEKQENLTIRKIVGYRRKTGPGQINMEKILKK